MLVNVINQFNEEEFNARQIRNAERNINELLSKTPTRREIAIYLCAMAENSRLGIDETPEWNIINGNGIFRLNEFKTDLTDVEKSNAIGEVGLARWEYVGNDN